MKKFIALLMSILLFGFAASAQEALFQAQNIQSPEVHDDNTVTFRIFAPNAQAVQVTGDFLPPVKMDTPMGPNGRSRKGSPYQRWQWSLVL